MGGRIILYGDVSERYEVGRLLGERHPEVHLESSGRSWELVERACTGAFDVVVILKGPIWEHQQRLDVVAGLRRNSFAGRIIYAGTFLTEKQEALAAGADHAFDPDQQATEEVAWCALHRPRLVADHPYLRYLFVGEWVVADELAGELPDPAPELLLAATSCHDDEAFFTSLARYSKEHPETHCVLVEDGGDEDVAVAALASGVQPYIVLAEEGLLKVAEVGRRLLRECWLARVSAA